MNTKKQNYDLKELEGLIDVLTIFLMHVLGQEIVHYSCEHVGFLYGITYQVWTEWSFFTKNYSINNLNIEV